MKKVTSMLRKERIDAMQAYISDVKTASMKELEDKFDIAPSTLRRDLASLIAAGTVKKVYGGVTDNTTTPSTKGNALTVYSERQLAAPTEKHQIGRAAAQLIEPEDLIFIDSGTTTAEMGGFLPTDFPFTLVTNNLQIINQAAPLANIKLVIIGMNFDRRTQSFTGIDDMNIFSRFNIGKAFMAATGISLTRGLSIRSTTNISSKPRSLKRRTARSCSSISPSLAASRFSLMVLCKTSMRLSPMAMLTQNIAIF